MDDLSNWFKKNNPFKTDSTFKGKGHVLGAKDDEEKRKQNQQQREDTNLAAARIKAEQHVGPEAAASLQKLLQQLLSSTTARSTCIPVLRKLLNNAVNEPDVPKFQRIRLTNPKIQATVVEVSGGLEYLQAAGFELNFTDAADGEGAEGFAVLPDERSAMPLLHAAVALLQAVPDPDTPPDGPQPQPRAASQAGPVPRMTQVLVPPEVDVSLLAPMPDAGLQMSGAE
eukprot:gene23555-28526_t